MKLDQTGGEGFLLTVFCILQPFHMYIILLGFTIAVQGSYLYLFLLVRILALKEVR